MSWRDSMLNTQIGRIIIGIIKIALAPFIMQLLGTIDPAGNITISGVTIDLGTIWNIIKGFSGLLLVISGLRDIGVKF